MGNALKFPRVAKVEGDLKWTILARDRPLWVYMHSDNTLESRSRGWYASKRRTSCGELSLNHERNMPLRDSETDECFKSVCFILSLDVVQDDMHSGVKISRMVCEQGKNLV